MIIRSGNITGSPFLLSANEINLPVFSVNPVGIFNSSDGLSPDGGTSETDAFPSSNLNNPATHLRWESEDSANDVHLFCNGLNGASAVCFAVHELSGFTVTIYGYTTDSPVDRVQVFEPTVISDNKPLMMEFPWAQYATIEIVISGSGVKRAAVCYVSTLLRMDRSVVVTSDLTPINRGLKTDVLSGFSESGNFLGRVVRNTMFEGTLTFSNEPLDAYTGEAEEVTYWPAIWFEQIVSVNPFFVAWAPDDYPDDVGFVWLTESPVPLQNPVTRRYSFSLKMRGIA